VRALRVSLLGLAVPLAGALTLWPAVARAQSDDDALEAPVGRRHEYHSGQHWALEFRFSPYKPNIDSDPALNGATPYKNVFGQTLRFFAGAELDWQGLRIPHFGSLGPGLSAGYTSISAAAQFSDGSGPSGENTQLQILPITAMAVLRIDALWRDIGIPLVPYAKLGLAYALWRASNTLGTSHFEGVTGEGHSIGWVAAGGLALNLNPFDIYAAENFDEAMGVNNTYIFAEFTFTDFDGLGLQSDPLRVGGPNWTFGLALEF
jgi:hypothetical protein